MKTYDYYLQHGPKGESIRRYPQGEEEGERWDDALGWTTQCAPRSSCLLTKDEVITEQHAHKLGARP